MNDKDISHIKCSVCDCMYHNDECSCCNRDDVCIECQNSVDAGDKTGTICGSYECKNCNNCNK